MSEQFRVRVDGPGVRVDREVDAQVAGQVLAILFGGSVPVPDSLRSRRSDRSLSTRPFEADLEVDEEAVERLRETLEVARNNPQRVAAIAVWLEATLGEEDLGLRPVEFEQWFELAGEKVPANVWQEVQKAVERELLREGPWDGCYQATSQAFAFYRE